MQVGMLQMNFCITNCLIILDAFYLRGFFVLFQQRESFTFSLVHFSFFGLTVGLFAF